jgi:DNA-binding transcriptional MerR regulator
MFTPEDVKNFQLIFHLVKERGFTLEGAKTHLKEGQKKTLDKFDIINKLEAIKAQLLSIKNEI